MPRARYRVSLIRYDMENRGWLAADLSRASKVPSATLTRFLTNKIQSPRTAKKIAEALDRPLSRYVIRRKVA